MRHLTVLALLFASLFPVPARAASTGDIVGIIDNQTTGRLQPGVKVTLTHLRRGDREPQELTATTDARGRYEFLGLATGDEHLYALDARHGGGLFPGGTIRLPDDSEDRPVYETSLKVWETTDDPNVILMRRNDLFVLLEEDEVTVVDSYRVVNTSGLAYIGRGGAGASTTLGFPLPGGARADGVAIVNEPRVGVPELRPTGFGFGITVAIPPGRTDFAFSYALEGSAGSYELTRTALYPILDTSVFAQEPLEIRSNRLEEVGPQVVGGRDYVRYSATEDIDAGDPIQMLAVAEAGMSSWLMAGVAVAFGLVALLLATGTLLRRRPSSGAVSTRPRPRDREGLVVAIAELDLRYRNGELGEAEWRTRREELKTSAEERAPEPTP